MLVDKEDREIELFYNHPNLLLCGDNNGIIYDRKEVQARLVDGIQRKPRTILNYKTELIKSILEGYGE